MQSAEHMVIFYTFVADMTLGEVFIYNFFGRVSIEEDKETKKAKEMNIEASWIWVSLIIFLNKVY